MREIDSLIHKWAYNFAHLIEERTIRLIQSPTPPVDDLTRLSNN